MNALFNHFTNTRRRIYHCIKWILVRTSTLQRQLNDFTNTGTRLYHCIKWNCERTSALSFHCICHYISKKISPPQAEIFGGLQWVTRQMTDHFRLKKLDYFLADHFGADHFSDFFFFRFPVFRCRSFQRSFCWIVFFDWAAIVLVFFFPHQDARSFSDDRFSKCCVSGTDSMFCYVMFPLATTT